MIEYSEKNIKTWSLIGSRATFGLVSLELAKKKKDIMILTSDVSTSAGLDRFRKTFPDKYIDVGIAEQNLIGIAAGLSSEGYKVFTTTFAPFQTMRCCEQIKVNLGYMKKKVNLIGLASGLVLGNLGYTHCCIEDLSITRSIPNLTVISPADCVESVKAIEASLDHKNSVYIRLTGGQNNVSVYKSDYKFEIGKAIKLLDGDDVAIFCTGTMVRECLLAADILKNEKINCSIINIHTIKPIDKKMIEEMSNKTKLIVSVEEHSVIGGLGSAISEIKSTLENAPRQLFIGVPDQYKFSGSYKYLKEKYGLEAKSIANEILNSYKS